MNDTDYVNKVKLLLPFFHLKVQNNQLPVIFIVILSGSCRFCKTHGKRSNIVTFVSVASRDISVVLTETLLCLYLLIRSLLYFSGAVID